MKGSIEKKEQKSEEGGLIVMSTLAESSIGDPVVGTVRRRPSAVASYRSRHGGQGGGEHHGGLGSTIPAWEVHSVGCPPMVAQQMLV